MKDTDTDPSIDEVVELEDRSEDDEVKSPEDMEVRLISGPNVEDATIRALVGDEVAEDVISVLLSRVA